MATMVGRYWNGECAIKDPVQGATEGLILLIHTLSSNVKVLCLRVVNADIELNKEDFRI